MPLEGIDDYTRFSNLIYDDDTVLPSDPRKLYTDFAEFFPYTEDEPDINYLVLGADFAAGYTEAFKIGPLAWVV